jgi:hypothetical protein
VRQPFAEISGSISFSPLVFPFPETVPNFVCHFKGSLHWRGTLYEFEAIAPGVFGVEAASAGDGVVVGDLDAASEESLAELIEIGSHESGMSFFGGVEVLFDADVKLLGAALKPASAARAKRLWFFDLLEAKERAIEFASGGFAALRSGDLDVIDPGDARIHT